MRKIFTLLIAALIVAALFVDCSIVKASSSETRAMQQAQTFEMTKMTAGVNPQDNRADATVIGKTIPISSRYMTLRIERKEVRQIATTGQTVHPPYTMLMAGYPEDVGRQNIPWDALYPNPFVENQAAQITGRTACYPQPYDSGHDPVAIMFTRNDKHAGAKIGG